MSRTLPWSALRAATLIALAGAPLLASAGTPLVDRPIVIAHRGASAYLPESTLPAYQLAVQMGADFIEPDLFLTADGVLVARHDRNLNNTTSGGSVNVDTLTWAQVQALNARSRGDSANTAGYSKAGNGYYGSGDRFKVASFQEVLDYAYGLYQADGRIVGVYPEVKTVSGNAAYNLAIADAMISALGDARYQGFFNGQHGNVFLQSFDEAVTRHLSDNANNPFDLPVAFLVSNCQTAGANAAAIAGFADGVGTSIANMTQGCVDQLHAAGLTVHAYTLTTDALMSPKSYATVLGWGVDGIFSNNPDLARAAVDTLYPAPVPEPGTYALFAAGLLALGALRRRAV